MLKKIINNKLALISFIIIIIYFIISILIWSGFICQDWDKIFTDGRTPSSLKHLLGTNINGKDILLRTLYSIKSAISIGCIVAFFAGTIGFVLGAFAGFFKRTWIDELIIWIYSSIDAIPLYLYVGAISFALKGYFLAIYIAMITSFWTTTCRITRSEVIKIKEFNFIEAARALGGSNIRIIFKHILPNTINIFIVQLSLLFITAIKTEVILSFLGIGLTDQISWGSMLAESSSEVIIGVYNNFLAASICMFILIISLNLFSDFLQDSFDPKYFF